MQAAFIKYASVLLEHFDKPLDYGIPEDLSAKIFKGSHVEVPVHGRLRHGYVIEIKDTPSYTPVRPIERALSDEELITEEIFELALWMSRYYCASLRQVLKIILPASVRKKVKHKEQLYVMRAKTREELKSYCESIRNKHAAQALVLDVMLKVKKGILLSELLEQTDRSRSPVDALAKKGFLFLDIVRIDRSPLVNEEYFRTKPKILNEDQAEALQKITSSIEERKFETHLLHGITGSGKTEIYLQAIEKVLHKNRGVIMLVPEISLTTQTIERFRSRFEGLIAVLHHRLSQGERFDEWQRIKRGEARIVIGARSAVFSPISDLGLLIVDEEHEQSYKQSEEAPCYHARDVAVMRGKMTNSAVILGSATPCVESYYNAKNSKYKLSQLRLRPDNSKIPIVKIIDMKKEFERSKGYTNFSEELLEGIKKRIENGEQTILFLNRRGYHTSLQCKQCGKAIKCRHCDITLTFHLSDNRLACHACGTTLDPPPKHCPLCKSGEPMKYRGAGTEQIEKALHAILPNVRTLRLDADTTKHKGSHQKLLREFGTGKADVMVGTQMIAKGLHFPEVTLVGVLNCDGGLNIPDFRASETTFQLITQVAGRAGRGALPGEVIIQTSMPDNSTIQLAAAQDYIKFFEEEIAVRTIFEYPPFTGMAKLVFSGTDERKIAHSAEQYFGALQRMLPEDYKLHPVVPAGRAKIKDKFRFQFLVYGPNSSILSKKIAEVKLSTPLPSQVKILVDINPLSTFF